MNKEEDEFLTHERMKVKDQFYIMNDAIVCLSDSQREVAFNGLCHTLHEKWDVKKYILGKIMNEFGFIYMLSCSECSEDYEWCDSCHKCF